MTAYSSEYDHGKLLRQCAELNSKCYSDICKLESTFTKLLEKCQRELRVVNARIEAFSRSKNGTSRGSKSAERYIKRTFSFPYFKDSFGFSHPSNEDVGKRNTLFFLSLCDIFIPCAWKKKEEDIVKNFIREEERNRWTQTLKRCGMLHLKNVEEMSLEELVESRFCEYDWLKLSVTFLNNVHSPHECRSAWINCYHPKLNQEDWTEEENSLLKELVEKNNYQNWQKISLDLGTQRSEFQCFYQFKKCLDCNKEVEWSDSETEFLKEIVCKFKILKYIPWVKIKRYIDGHNLQEIYFHWNKINSNNRPKTFSLEEDIVLVAGMKLLGKEYSEILTYLPDRSVAQIRNRINVLMGRQFPSRPWTKSEDLLLRSLVEKYGFGNWLKMSVHFLNRDASSLRLHYATLLRRDQEPNTSDKMSSFTIRNPKTKYDIVNLEMLWETVQNICRENNLNIDVNGQLKSESHGNIKKLSDLLKPQQRHFRMIERKKLIPILESEFAEYFRSTYMLHVESLRRSYLAKQMIPTQVHDLIIALKILKAKIELPEVQIVKNDSTLSNLDKSLLKYILQQKSTFQRINHNSPFVLSNYRENFVQNYEQTDSDPSNNSCGLFPPNSANLIALRSLLLHRKTLKRQEEGLTLQVDNTEYKYARNSKLTMKDPSYGVNYQTSRSLWNDRIFQILFWSTLMSNEVSQRK